MSDKTKTASITCPQCGKTSYHPEDIKRRYCGFCHQFHEQMKLKTQQELLEWTKKLEETSHFYFYPEKTKGIDQLTLLRRRWFVLKIFLLGIHTEDDYTQALKEMEILLDRNNKPESKDNSLILWLASEIGRYEKLRYPTL